MEKIEYLLYSTKMNAWLSNANYVDDVEQAARFSYPEALDRVKAHYDKHSKQFMLICVPAEILSFRA